MIKEHGTKCILYIEILKTAIFIVGFCLLFFMTQSLLVPRWNYPLFDENVSIGLDAFFEQDKNIDEVLILGTSHPLYGISPMEMYESHRIVSYNLATSSQPLGVTYYMLQKAFETQQPKVVVLDVSRILNNQNHNSAWRYVLDVMPFGKLKIDMSKAYANQMAQSDGNIESWSTYFWSGIFPIIQYHNRWAELSEADFRYNNISSISCTNGYFINTGMISSGDDIGYVDRLAYEDSLETEKHSLIYEDGVACLVTEEDYLYAPAITEQTDCWLKKISALCEENDAELLLIKVPTNRMTASYSGAWTEIKSNTMKAYAMANQLNFLDMQYDVDLGLDWRTDTPDGGTHLNYVGAKKVSSFLGQYLNEHYEVGGKSVDSVDEKLAIYKEVTAIADMMTEIDTLKYLDILSAYSDRIAVCMAVSKEYMYELPEDISEALWRLGLNIDYKDYDDKHSYIAYIEGRDKVYEQLCDRPITWSVVCNNAAGTEITIKSSAWRTDSNAEIIVDGVNYAVNYRGLNIVVIDKETGLVIDRVVTDSATDPYFCDHWGTLDLLERYYVTIDKR